MSRTKNGTPLSTAGTHPARPASGCPSGSPESYEEYERVLAEWRAGGGRREKKNGAAGEARWRNKKNH